MKKSLIIAVLAVFTINILSFAEEIGGLDVNSICNLNPQKNRWEVVNTTSERVRMTYQVVPSGNAKSVWIKSGQKKIISQKPSFGNVLKVEVDATSIEVLKSDNTCEVNGFELISVCSDNPAKRKWRVRNPMGYAIQIRYEVYGTSATKSKYLKKAGKAKEKWEGDGVFEYSFFETNNDGGANTLKVYYGDNQVATKASCNCVCPVDASAISFSSVCSERNNKFKWEVLNSTNKKVWVKSSFQNKWFSVNAATTELIVVPNPNTEGDDIVEVLVPGKRNFFSNTNTYEASLSFGDNQMSAIVPMTTGPCVEVNASAVFDSQGVFYIDNTSDNVYSVELEANSKTGNSATLTPLFKSPYGGAHMSLNTVGNKLFLVQGGGANRYGYLDLVTLEYRELGRLNQNGIYQVTFSPSGQMYFAANKINEVMVMDDPLSGVYESYGTITLDWSSEEIALNGADMAFDEDGTFYIATHAGKQIFTVGGVKDHLVATFLNTTDGKLATGLAVLNAGNGELIFSAKKQTAMTTVNVETGVFTEYPIIGDISVMEWGDMTTGSLTYRDICGGNASAVVSYTPGTLASGLGAPAANRQIAENALGAPQESDNLNFVSLGFGGELIVELASPVYNHNKNGILVDNPNSINFGETSYADLVIVETSYGHMNKNCGADRNKNYPEKALIYGVQNLGDKWVLLSETQGECRTSFIDVAAATEGKSSMDFIKYLRFVDVTEAKYHNSSADGYDVDGVIICPGDVTAAITGSGRSSLANARGEEEQVLNHGFFNRAPNDLGASFEVAVYPNPLSTQNEFQVRLLGEWEQASYELIDLSGSKALSGYVDQTNDKINVNELSNGIYILKVAISSLVYKTIKVRIER